MIPFHDKFWEKVRNLNLDIFNLSKKDALTVLKEL